MAGRVARSSVAGLRLSARPSRKEAGSQLCQVCGRLRAAPGPERGRLAMGHVTLTASVGNTGVSSMPRRCGMGDSAVLNRTFRHVGFFYRTEDEYAATVARFLRDGLAADEPVFAAIPPARIALVRDALGADAPRVEFADMTDMGRNPAWIIPRVLAFTGQH